MRWKSVSNLPISVSSAMVMGIKINLYCKTVKTLFQQNYMKHFLLDKDSVSVVSREKSFYGEKNIPNKSTICLHESGKTAQIHTMSA